ncbi:ATP-binding protein [Clostridium gasigenes]|uniref:ATP-binding protein n=1 Tax=Clostridium gasigenes TaxID=94869 RepID=UPI001C0C8ABB|nr:ATP-binding protein [Clostridium gasigenes]MBU3134288.1 ATP-binding protein [Clostridium gasigenes]
MLETNLFWTSITILSVIIEWSVLKVILNELSNLKNTKLISNINLIIAISSISILTLIEVNPNVKLFMGILIAYTFYICNYEISLLKGLVIILFYYMILLGFNVICSSLVILLSSIEDLNILLSTNIFRLQLIISTKSLLLCLIPIAKSIKLKIKIKKSDYMYITIPIFSNIINIIIIFGFIFNDSNIKSIILLFISSIFLLSNISLINIMWRIIKDNNLKIENKIINNKMEIQYKYYLNLQKYQSKTRKLYHDMNNHIICIQNMYEKNDIADKYVEDIHNKLKECNPIFNTNSVILDVILNEKKSSCDINNIELLVDLNFQGYEFIEMPDICSIFSNIIDNAIEANNKLTDEKILKIIKLRGTIVNSFFVIKCENPKKNLIISKNNKILTDKKDGFLHGIGISSIKTSVEKYGGNLEIKSSDTKFIIIIYIPLI